MPIISTKLYIPPTRPVSVRRSRLIEGLNGGLHRKLTLVSASTGFGKTTLLSEWLAGCDRPAAWLSLDDGDNDPARFLTYLIAAWQSISNGIGAGALALLQTPQPPIDSVLAVILSDIAAASVNAILVLDDYHVIEASPIHEAIALLIERMPPNVHLVIATRHDPPIPLGRLRSRDLLNELRAADLRFTYPEVADFLCEVMNLDLSPDDISLLETRTEGWIAGLQLAAISMQGHHDASGFIQSFSGSHRFVLDYLIEEVLLGQSEDVQRFLIQTSILDRLCGPLCNAIMGQHDSDTGQRTLEYLERANLFLVPLDSERLWYRYHHLFADLLRQRLRQHQNVVSDAGGAVTSANELNLRASIWYEDNGLEIEAFRYAVAAEDHIRAARLLEGGGMPLIFRGAVTPALRWLESLSKPLLKAMPSLLVLHASALLMVGQLNGAEQKLQTAEAALQEGTLDDKTRDAIGHIASIRATIAVSQHQVDSIIAESRLALEYLHPENLPVRTATTWTLGYAYQLQGDRAAARKAYVEAIAISRSIGHFIINVMAAIGLGGLQEKDNQLELAADTYRSVLELVGDTPMPASSEAHLGLARISCEWNDIAAAEQHLRQSFLLASQIENTDRYVVCELLQARLQLARGEVSEAAAAITRAGQFARQHNFVLRMPEVAAAHAAILLRQGNVPAAAQLVSQHEMPISLAKVYLAEGDASTAVALLETFRSELEAKRWESERLAVMVVQSIALHRAGDKSKAMEVLCDALELAEPGGFIRLFVDEGAAMKSLLSEAAAKGVMPNYSSKLLAAFEAETTFGAGETHKTKLHRPYQPLIEPLSERELLILRLIADGLSNQEIGSRLYLALSTVKGHIRNVFDKLQVKRRTEAVARARELGLL